MVSFRRSLAFSAGDEMKIELIRLLIKHDQRTVFHAQQFIRRLDDHIIADLPGSSELMNEHTSWSERIRSLLL